jgi:ABC-type oligopeptide transport system substrate-binding subunit
MLNNKFAVLTLAAILSSASLAAVAADKTSSGSTEADGTSQTKETGPKPTNADPDAASLPQGADSGKTDNGPVPAGSKTSTPGQVGGGSSGGGS